MDLGHRKRIRCFKVQQSFFLSVYYKKETTFCVSLLEYS